MLKLEFTEKKDDAESRFTEEYAAFLEGQNGGPGDPDGPLYPDNGVRMRSRQRTCRRLSMEGLTRLPVRYRR